jgi:hypothetical protein
VLVFNGNAGDRSPCAPLVDYRGYGRNPGSPSEKGQLGRRADRRGTGLTVARRPANQVGVTPASARMRSAPPQAACVGRGYPSASTSVRSRWCATPRTSS